MEPKMPVINAPESPGATLSENQILASLDKAGRSANQGEQQLPNKSFLQLLSLSIGFLGIQFAWSIQMGQMSPLLERLGSVPWLTSLIWCAGPVTGIVVQPIVGSLSDRTWTVLGRRRPFLLVGAILTALSLILMPNSPSLLVAAALLWILDASINVSQGPYRALVPDVVPKSQQTFTYALMSFTIGLGSVAAFSIGGLIPSMHNLFYLGAVSMLVAMGWTILTTPEVKRPNSEIAEASPGFFSFIRQTWESIVAMPWDIKKLCIMHSFTWFGLQCLFIFFSLYVAHNLFGTHDANSATYQQAIQKASICYAALNMVCFLFSPMIGKLSNLFSKKAVHTFGLLCLSVSMISMFYLKDPNHALVAMGIMGIGWATTLSVPFAILAERIPAGKEGVLMGTFNIFIAAPQFLASTLAGLLVTQTQNDASALVLGGAAVLLSAFLLQWVKE